MDGPRSKLAVVGWALAGSLVGGAALATVLLWRLGDWHGHRWGLSLTLRIVWGCCLGLCLAVVLTAVTAFGWRFRRYRRALPAAEGAPWYKSGAFSFAMTVTLVSLFGSCAVASLVLWMLADVLGGGVLGLVLKIIWGSWWVLCIALVLVRVGVFRVQVQQAARRQAATPEPPDGPAGRADAPASERAP